MVGPNLTMTGWFGFLANRVHEASLVRARSFSMERKISWSANAYDTTLKTSNQLSRAHAEADEHRGRVRGSQEGQAFDPRFQLRGSTPGSATFQSEDLSGPVSLQRAEFIGDPAYSEGSSVVLWHDRYVSSSPALSIT
jgi:hypothetical protein